MIDFVKIVLTNRTLINKVWENENLIFHSDQSRRYNDEIRDYRKKKYRGLTFTLFADKLEITGSLHYYFNNGVHNANDFCFADCIRIIYELQSVFDLNLHECMVVNLEFGLNIIPGESGKNIVVWIRFHERNEFRFLPDQQYAKQSGRFSAKGKINTYKIIKAYVKGIQLFEGKNYGDPNNFRFEVKSKQSKYINKLGVFTLNDLTNPEIYFRLGDELLKEWGNIVILDKSLQRTVDKLDRYLSQDFWENCLNGDRNKFARHRRKYFALLEKHPKNIHNQVAQLLNEKLRKFGNELKNDAISTRPTPTISKKKGTISTRPKKIPKNENDAHSTIVKVESALSDRKCTQTGLPIPNVQESYTTNLTEKGVQWYFENEPEIFREKLESLLTEDWKQKNRDKTKKIWINEIYHSLRNKQSNPKNNLYRSYKNIESKGAKLFPMEETIPPEKLSIVKERKMREQEALEKVARTLRIISTHYADKTAILNSVNLQKVNQITHSQQLRKL